MTSINFKYSQSAIKQVIKLFTYVNVHAITNYHHIALTNRGNKISNSKDMIETTC